MQGPRATYFRRPTGLPVLPLLLTLTVLVMSVPGAIGSPAPHPAAPRGGASTHSHLHLGHGPLFLPPRHRPAFLPATPSFNVYPYNLYSSEPAPMGLGDFGVDNNGTLYSYQTNQFLATANITKLSFDNPSLSSYGVEYDGTMQLNVVLDFTAGGVLYNYWIQDVLYVSTSTNTVMFENNIWNLTSGNGGMLSSTVGGNGSVYSSTQGGFYYAGASTSGSGVSLTYPSIIRLYVKSAVVFGIPRVYFGYYDGASYGWQTYDTAVFFATKVSSAMFTVDGSNYVDSFLYSDAELTFGGPGSGFGTTMKSGQVGLTIQYFNGHNFQEIPNGFNFGSNTAEAINNTVEKRGIIDGVPLAAVSAGSGGAPALLYDRGYSAIFNGTTRYLSGTYSVNGIVVGPYIGGEVNLTLAPGNYLIDILQNGSVVQKANITLTGGEYLAYSFNPGGEYAVTFTSEGLPLGTPWQVSLGPIYHGGTTGAALTLQLPNGTYNYLVQVVPGYDATPRNGVVVVNGANVSVGNITWTVHVYLQYVKETGLPTGTAWEITLNGVNYPETANQFSVPLSNGSYAWTVWGLPGFGALVTTGLVNVTGSVTPLTITFVARDYSVLFHEIGLPTASANAWQVTVNGALRSGSGGFISVNLPNGTYAYTVPSVGAYDPAPASGSVVVNGLTASVVVTYSPRPGTVSLTILPVNATITVNGASVSANASGSYILTLPPGTYNITFSAPGFEGANQTLTIAPGQSISLGQVHLVPKPSGGPPGGTKNSTSSTTPWLEYGLLAAILIAAVVLLAVAASRRRGGTSP